MNTRQMITLGTAGIGTFLATKYTSERINAPGGIPVRNGALQWDDRFDDVPDGHICDINGTTHRIGTAGAVNAMYEIAAEYSRLTYDASRLVRQSLTESQLRHLDSTFRNTGKFDLSILDQSQKAMVQTMVNAFVNFGQSLRVLAHIYRAAGIERMYRPAVWARRNINLANIIHRSILNPLVTRTGPMQYQPRIMRVSRPIGWIYIGWEIIQAFLNAYDLEIQGERYLIEDMERAGEILEDNPNTVQTMGIEPATTAALITFAKYAITAIIVAGTIVICLPKVIEAVSLFLGRNLSYARMQTDMYEEAMRCAMDPNRSPEERNECRRLAAQLSDDIESYTPGLGTGITAIVIGGIGLGAYYLYKRSE